MSSALTSGSAISLRPRSVCKESTRIQQRYALQDNVFCLKKQGDKISSKPTNELDHIHHEITDHVLDMVENKCSPGEKERYYSSNSHACVCRSYPKYRINCNRINHTKYRSQTKETVKWSEDQCFNSSSEETIIKGIKFLEGYQRNTNCMKTSNTNNKRKPNTKMGICKMSNQDVPATIANIPCRMQSSQEMGHHQEHEDITGSANLVTVDVKSLDDADTISSGTIIAGSYPDLPHPKRHQRYFTSNIDTRYNKWKRTEHKKRKKREINEKKSRTGPTKTYLPQLSEHVTLLPSTHSESQTWRVPSKHVFPVPSYPNRTASHSQSTQSEPHNIVEKSSYNVNVVGDAITTRDVEASIVDSTKLKTRKLSKRRNRSNSKNTVTIKGNKASSQVVENDKIKPLFSLSELLHAIRSKLPAIIESSKTKEKKTIRSVSNNTQNPFGNNVFKRSPLYKRKDTEQKKESIQPTEKSAKQDRIMEVSNITIQHAYPIVPLPQVRQMNIEKHHPWRPST